MAATGGENAAWWREFMMTDEAQEALVAQREEDVEEAIETYEAVTKPAEAAALAAALCEASVEVKEMVAPLLKYDFAQRVLFEALTQCRQSGLDFSDYVSGSAELGAYLEKASAEVRADPARGVAMNDEWWAMVRAAARQDYEERVVQSKRQRREGSSDGDVCFPPPADALAQTMNAGSMSLTLGRKKFAEKRYHRALEHFDRGVETIESVFRRDDELLCDLYAKLLGNQALTALKLDKWNKCIDACGTLLAFRPNDVAALYRRGLALTRKGHLDDAKLDFQKATKTLESSWDDPFDREAALRDLAKQLRRLDVEAKRAHHFDTGMMRKAAAAAAKKKTARQDDDDAQYLCERKPSLFETNVDAVLAFQKQQRRVFEAARGGLSQHAFRRHLRSAQIALLPDFGLPATPDGLDAAERAIAKHLATDDRVRANATAMVAALADHDDLF